MKFSNQVENGQTQVWKVMEKSNYSNLSLLAKLRDLNAYESFLPVGVGHSESSGFFVPLTISSVCPNSLSPTCSYYPLILYYQSAEALTLAH